MPPNAGKATVPLTDLATVPMLQISRRGELQGLLSVWFLFVDDVPVARLRNGGTRAVTVTNGRHTLMVGLKSRSTRSDAVELDFSSSRPVRLKCQVNPKFRKMVFFGTSGSLIELKPDEANSP